MKWVLAAVLGSATGLIVALAIFIEQPQLLEKLPGMGHTVLAPTDVTPSMIGFVNETPANTHCSSGLTSPFAVEAVFIDHGTIETPVQISEEAETHQVNVDVTREDQPVFLVLAAYNPVIWKVRTTPHARIVGVLLSGYYQQMLVGLPKDTFVVKSTLIEHQCSWRFLDNEAHEKGKSSIDPVLHNLIGRTSDTFLYRAFAKQPVVIGPEDKVSELPAVDDPVIPAGVKVDTTPHLYGQGAVDDLIDRKLLRKAQTQEVISWLRGLQHLQPREKEDIEALLMLPPDKSVDLTLVALQAVAIPKSMPVGMTIIVPEGVPTPTGELNRVTLWYIKPHRCVGVLCDGNQ